MLRNLRSWLSLLQRPLTQRNKLRTSSNAESSFGWRRFRIAGDRLRFPFSEQSRLQPVEIDINNGRRIEREDLRQGETPDDGIAERLANFGTDSGTQHHRHGAEQRSHRRHEN